MSNTGYKGITDMREWGLRLVRVQVQWRRENHQIYIPILRSYKAALKKAIKERNRLERELGKPRTERQIRFDGVMVNKLLGKVKWRRNDNSGG